MKKLQKYHWNVNTKNPGTQIHYPGTLSTKKIIKKLGTRVTHHWTDYSQIFFLPLSTRKVVFLLALLLLNYVCLDFYIIYLCLFWKCLKTSFIISNINFKMSEKTMSSPWQSLLCAHSISAWMRWSIQKQGQP